MANAAPMTPAPAGMAETAARWRSSPLAFVREVCSGTVDAWQVEFLNALGANKKLALKACKGPGKTRALAWAVWWWLFTRPHSNVVCMSITSDNLRDNLWAELARVQNEAPMLKTYFEHRGERILSKKSPTTWMASARSFPQNADKNQQASTIAGMHGIYPMIACDEVGDYPDGVVVAAEAIFANDVDAKLVIAGNPTQTEGPLYRVCTRDRYDWWVKEITGDPDDPARATRISVEWARKMINDWGRDNDWVRVNVFGQFPSSQSNKLLGPEEVRAAMSRTLHKSEYDQEPVIMGLDVARFGDNESVLVWRQGFQVWRPMTWRETDLMTLADQVASVYAQQRPSAIFVDQTGVGGGVVDRLRQLGIMVTPVDGGGKPIDDRFFDRRSEMWWLMAEWLKKGAAMPHDSQLLGELIAPNYDFSKNGRATKFKLESKKDLIKRGQQSPDRADAIALTFAAPVHSPFSAMQSLDQTGPANPKIKGGTEDDWDPYQDAGGRAFA